MVTRASASVAGKRLAPKVGIWKWAKRVKVGQGDGSYLRGNLVLNMTIKVTDSYSVLGKFAMDAEILDIANGDVILGFSVLMEHGLSVDIQDMCLRKVNPGQVIPGSDRCLPEVLIVEEEQLVDCEILLIIDGSE